MTEHPTAADITAGPKPLADAQAREEQKQLESPTSVPSRREELTSDLVEQQRHLRSITAIIAGAVIVVLYIFFICTISDINSHRQDINQYTIWFLSLIALPPTLLLVVLMKGIFAVKDDKQEAVECADIRGNTDGEGRSLGHN